MPYSEIEKRFRTSELIITGWRSGERAANMDKRMNRPTALPPNVAPQHPALKGVLPAALPASCFNAEGEPDVSKMTSAQAIRFLRAAGFVLAASPDIERQIAELGEQTLPAPREPFQNKGDSSEDAVELTIEGQKVRYEG